MPAPQDEVSRKGRRFPAAFCHWETRSLHLCCIAKWNMLPCKQTDCGWHLVYLDWSLADNAAIRCRNQGTHHVQHHFFRPRSFGGPFQSLHDLHRSLSDGARRLRGAQRRPALFRSLSSKSAAAEYLRRSRVDFQFLPDYGPGVPGPFFYPDQAPASRTLISWTATY